MNRILEVLDQRRNKIDIKALYQAACKDVAENVHANRTSIWHFDPDKTSIHCDCYYVTEKDEFSSGSVLHAHSARTYFQTIQTEQYIVAPDARVMNETACLAEQYLVPNDIHSLLDYIIHNDYKPVGIICCENAFEKRYWTEADKKYLLEVSTLVSFSLMR